MHAVGSLVHITRDGKGIGPLVVEKHEYPYHNLNNLDGTPHSSGWLKESLTRYTPDLDFFRLGDVVEVTERGKGIVVNIHRLSWGGYIRVVVEGAGILSPERPWTDGFPVHRVKFLARGHKVAQTFKLGDTVRFTSGPHNGVVAKVETSRDDGRMLWVKLPSGELSGGWFPERFELATPRNAEEVKQVAGNNAQTYQVAVEGLQKLLVAGFSEVSIRPRTWDTKGLYAAILVKQGTAETALYTPEQVATFIKAQKPIEVVGKANPFDNTRFEFYTATGQRLYSPVGDTFWKESELIAAKSRTTLNKQGYLLGRLLFTPFTPQG